MIFPVVLLLSFGFPASANPAHSLANQKRQESSLPSAPSPKQDLGYARKLIEAGNYKEALKTLEQIKAQSPRTSGLNRELGIA